MPADKFLTEIDYPDHKVYGDIDRYFVPPTGFDTIKKTFRQKHIIFLLGPHGCGKTFMAVKLLWDLFQEGIKSLWVRWGMIDNDQISWKLLVNPQSLLAENTGIYIEDPFGKVQYGFDQWFDKHTLLDLVDFFVRGFDEQGKTYLILTSSSEIYQEFEATLWPEDITFLRSHANFVFITYSSAGLHEVLTRWASYFECPWIKLDNTPREVLPILDDNINMMSPLVLKDIAFFTRHTVETSIPVSLLRAQANNLWGATARGIAMLSWQQKAFLARFFISSKIQKKRAAVCLKQFSDSANKDHTISLDELLSNFKDIFLNEFGGVVLEFTTSGHFEVLGLLLEDDPEFVDIFNRWVLFLAQHNVGIPNLLWTVVRHFSKLNHEVQKVALEFQAHEGNCEGDDLALPILLNYNHLPAIVQELLLPQVKALAGRSKGDDHRSAYQFSLALYRKFPPLPPNLREALLEILSHIPDALEVPWITLYYYDLLPPALRQLPFRLINDKELAQHLAFDIGELFHKLPSEIQALAWTAAKGSEFVPSMLAAGLFRNFNNLTPEARELLTELAQRDMLRAHLPHSQRSVWTRIPPKDLEALLRTASQKPGPITSVAEFIINNYPLLPESTRALLFEILDPAAIRKKIEVFPPESEPSRFPFLRGSRLKSNPMGGWISSQVARVIIWHAKKLPRKVLELLLSFAEQPKFLRFERITLNDHFNDLPEDIRKSLLDKVAKQEPWSSFGDDVFEQRFQTAPPEQRLSILEQAMSEEDSYLGFRRKATIFKMLVKDFESLDPKTKAMLLTYARKESSGYSFGTEVLRGPRPIPQGLLELFLEVTDKSEVLKSLGTSILKHYNDLPSQIQDLIMRIPLGDKLPFNKFVETILEHYGQLPKRVQNLLGIIERDKPEDLASGILSCYSSAPPEFQERLPSLFERANDPSHLASSLSLCISWRIRERTHRPRSVPTPRPPRRSDIRKSAERLKEEAAWHEKFRKFDEDSEKRRLMIAKKFLPLPAEVEHRLLSILISRGPTEGLVYLVAKNFSALDPAISQLLFTWAKDAKWVGKIATAIGFHYKDSPDSVKNLFRDLVLTPVTDPAVGRALITAYPHLPENLQQQVFIFAKQASMQGELAVRIAQTSKHLPDAVVELLVPLEGALMTRLQEDFKTERGMEWRMMDNFILEETRMPYIKNRVRAMFEASQDEEVQKWLVLVKKNRERLIKLGMNHY